MNDSGGKLDANFSICEIKYCVLTDEVFWWRDYDSPWRDNLWWRWFVK